ncbi:AAA family ATPase [Cellulophaga lytica]|uniref:ATPase associated with various cellular activities AAA_3 n=1 Tax=Cellulophaga lytica (strain ATCC 23178 / DSM 7489 / JCM 8516 / NBRC 14961 / NCIMB 1423 / VKM B-1433 / Cy l20) TaxID=867900 RepID=F0RGM1_CELLC|nr:MoxR family ATPase [Cellulophaga lytica]ADY28046.1 ATPase associated with various cellular activities AAA_3 [Cellulophaga lytica DSM 7489]AIM59124.1 magnesium chelatase [Cellulophaga lytica]WQG77765.1 MoxR family ATPase [Cellulophaga lytica]SNQ41947.1 MoxR-like ATPase [Cellulophaga lytica]
MEANNDINFDNRIPLEDLKNAVTGIKQELAKVIIGQDRFVELLIVSLLVDGHVLIEGVPGIAKTVTAKLFAKTLKTDFSRIQFTPDLMPSDILGTSIFNVKSSEFEFKKGPIFSNIILIDEINRAPAKTQAALFEIMEETQVTMDGKTYKMEAPFMVLATQNPIEQEGTYALPEAQLDRFLFKIKVEYPTLEEEIKIITTHHERKGAKPQTLINDILSPTKLKEYKKNIQDVIVEAKILRYIAEIISKTRNHPHLYLGGSPRASLATLNAAKAFAAINGRDFVTPEDVKKALEPVLNHRVILTPEREMEGMTTESVVHMIIESVEIPR